LEDTELTVWTSSFRSPSV